MRAAVVIAITMAVIPFGACGLGPATDEAQPFSTGTAPWQELGVAQICFGTQTLAPATTAPGGLCQSIASSDPVACASDADCGSRESCACGLCMVAYCAVSSDCVAPRICNFAQHRCDLPCEADGDCAAGERCLGSVCRARCLDGGDCQQGEVCEGNTCISDDCSTDDDCFGEEKCLVQRIPRQLREPSPVRDGDRLILYLELADLTAPAPLSTPAVFRAVATDPGGLRFVIEPLEPVSTGRAPTAVVDGDLTFLYVERGDGEALDVAASIDGISFTAATQLLTGPDVHAPTAIHVDGAVHLYYARAGSIGYATGPVGAALEDRGIVLAPVDAEVGDPVGAPDAAFWRPITTLASPHASLLGPDGAHTIGLWFAGFGRESADGERFGMPAAIPPNFSVGFAGADLVDAGRLVVWPYGPIADRVEVFLEHRDELGPAVVERAPGSFRLYLLDATHDAASPGTFTLGRLVVLGSGR